jgi:hypothetical protein
MSIRPCIEAGCSNPATSRKGRCDKHHRAYERERSRNKRGGLKRGGYDNAVGARDRNPEYRYPKR